MFRSRACDLLRHTCLATLPPSCPRPTKLLRPCKLLQALARSFHTIFLGGIPSFSMQARAAGGEAGLGRTVRVWFHRVPRHPALPDLSALLVPARTPCRCRIRLHTRPPAHPCSPAQPQVRDQARRFITLIDELCERGGFCLHHRLHAAQHRAARCRDARR